MVDAPAAVAPAGGSVHVGRQPIFDAERRLHAYELLFRTDATAAVAAVAADPDAADRATTATILSAFSGFAVAELLGGRPGFVNLTRTFLVGDLPVPFEPDHAVLEVLENVVLDDEVVEGVRALDAAGYRIALDDFVWHPAADRLVELAAIVKIDVLTPWSEVEGTLRRCRELRGDDLVLLAERVEDEETFQRCRAAGFTLFQGYHTGRPQTLSAQAIRADRMVALQLLGRLSAEDVSVAEIDRILRADPGLVLQLLRLANASSNGLGRTLTAVSDAVVLLGLKRLRAWMVLLAVSGMGADIGHASPVLVRGRTCEELAVRLDRPGLAPEAAFIVGLLDGIAELMAVPAKHLMEGLPPLAPVIHDALVGRSTPLRGLLEAVRGYHLEPGAAPPGPAGLLGPGGTIAPQDLIRDSFLAALAWTTQIMAAAQENDPR